MPDKKGGVPGWYLKEAMAITHTTEEELAAMIPPTHAQTISRWRRAGTGTAGTPEAIPTVIWLGCLSALDLPKDWRPKSERGKK